jgi:uncharacterized phage-associated protein
MPELSTNFENELTKPLIGFTHEERGPWDKIWDGGRETTSVFRTR